MHIELYDCLTTPQHKSKSLLCVKYYIIIGILDVSVQYGHVDTLVGVFMHNPRCNHLGIFSPKLSIH